MLNAGFVCFLIIDNCISGQTVKTNISFARLIVVFCLFGRCFVNFVCWLGFFFFTTEDETHSFYMVLYH